MGRVDGKIVLVTGAGSGIGREGAMVLAREGATVIAADINGEGAEGAAAAIRKEGGKAQALRVDITRSDQVRGMIEKIVAEHKRLDCAVNNAGVEAKLGARLEETEEADFDRLIGINLKGTWLCMKYEIPQMRRQGGGVIVNTASALGLIGCLGFSSYVASKHAIVGLTKCAALENAKDGIRINALCPAATRTPMLDRAEGVDWDAVQPMGRTGTVAEAAQGMLWLCSDESSFTTGHTLLLDGGWVAG